ncbi:MAG TPA: nucleoside hydrolase [Candidatus Methylomirabilis sp.]|nr:nucleoside hydrolase [Candidatus Methylomirabilis sp.]
MRRVIIDTDPGIDDALALFLALQSPELTVEAITTVAGNTRVEDCTRNVFLILELLKPDPRPVVAQGAARPLECELRPAPDVHGEDGLGELFRHRNPDGLPRYPQPLQSPATVGAADLILELIRRYPGEITLITLGPLTNIAQALRRDRKTMEKISRIITMGGAVLVPGNTSATAEFNIATDPEAARIVLGSGLPLTLIPLDVTERVRISGEALRTWMEPLADLPAQFLLDCTAHLVALSAKWKGFAGIALHDPLTVGVVIDPHLVKTQPLYVQVETRGEITTGMTVADRRPFRAERQPNVEVALDVDADRFLSLFVERLCRRS